MQWLKRFLIPSEENGYAPSSLEKKAVSVMFFLVVLTFLTVNVQSFVLVRSDWFLSSILPAAIVALTNDSREDGALRNLSRNPVLDEAARRKAEHMASEGYFAHESPDGITPWHWFREAGYSYSYAGENLAVLFSDSSDVVDAWMDSPGHRANIMSERYTDIGIGLAEGTYKGKNTVFVVQLFGAPLTQAREITGTSEVAEMPNTEAMVLSAVDQSNGSSDSKIFEKETQNEYAAAITEDSEENFASEKIILEDSEAPREILAYAPLATATPSSEPPDTAQVPAQNPISEMHVESRFKLFDLFAQILSGPSIVLSFTYLLLTLTVAVMLILAVVLEWRRQHPLQVAYGVGLIALMALALQIHVALTAGVIIA